MKLLFIFLLFPTITFAKSFVPNSFSANFEESFVSVGTGKEKKSFGKIDYKYPSHIRYEKTQPDPSLFVSNPKISWFYVPPFMTGEQGQVTIQKSSKLPIAKFLDSVKNGLEGSKLFTYKFEGKDLVLTFVRTIQKEMTLKQVILSAAKEAKEVQKLSEFEKIILVSNDKPRVTLKLLDLKEDVPFSNDHFVFDVPAKTKVTK